MKYFFLALLLCNMQLLGMDIHWDGTDSGKNTYTQTVHQKYKSEIEELAKSTFQETAHPFYQMLFWIKQSSTGNKLESWLVHHLLNTAGHWGWSQDKTASNYETNIYYEVGLCQFLVNPYSPVITQAPKFLAQIQKDSLQAIQDADDFRINGDSYFKFRVLWREKNGWESNIDSKGCLTAYYMMSLGISSSLQYGVPLDQDAMPYKKAGAYQKMDPHFLAREQQKVLESAQYAAQLLTQGSYSTTQLLNDKAALDAFLQAVQSGPSLTSRSQQTAPTTYRSYPEEWEFTLEDGTTISRDASWIYFDYYQSKSINLNAKFINKMPLSAALELKHASNPREMLLAIKKAGLKVTSVMPPSLSYLLT